MSGPVERDPLIDCGPVHAPDAVHVVAPLAVHVTVELPPVLIELGAALIVTMGAGVPTVTVVDCVAVPPAPVQLIVKVVVAVSGAVVCEPLVDKMPFQPPPALQPVASLEDQLSKVLAPGSTVFACADRLTDGAGAATTTSACWTEDPLGPEQVSTNVVFAARDAIVAVPLTGFVPLQPPLAMQLSAFSALHTRVVLLPGATLFGVGWRLMSGPVAAVVLAVGPALTLEPELLHADSRTRHVTPTPSRWTLQRSKVFSDPAKVFAKRPSHSPRHWLL